MTEKEWTDMKIGERKLFTTPYTNYSVLRVPGGWIVDTLVFVPDPTYEWKKEEKAASAKSLAELYKSRPVSFFERFKPTIIK